MEKSKSKRKRCAEEEPSVEGDNKCVHAVDLHGKAHLFVFLGEEHYLQAYSFDPSNSRYGNMLIEKLQETLEDVVNGISYVELRDSLHDIFDNPKLDEDSLWIEDAWNDVRQVLGVKDCNREDLGTWHRIEEGIEGRIHMFHKFRA